MNKLLGRFAVWFASAAGVWETTIVVVAILVAELTDRNLDPHAFALMAALTIYSGVTQPMLAYSNEQAARRLMRVERRMVRLEEALCGHFGIDIPSEDVLDVPVTDRVSKAVTIAARAEADHLG